MLQDPNYVRVMAQTGMSVPTYAYANNNPVNYTDPDGRMTLVLPDGEVVNWPDALLPLIPIVLPPLLCNADPRCRDLLAPPANWPERVCMSAAKTREEVCKEAKERAYVNCLKSDGMGNLIKRFKECQVRASICNDMCIEQSTGWKKQCLQGGPRQ